MHELDETNVFVKYLPQDINDEKLKELFSSCGEIVSVKVMVDTQTGSSLGYGFVRFSRPYEAQRAIKKLSGHKVMNKFLLCKLSHSALLTPSDLSTNLYLKPLPPTMTEDDLYKVFCKFGPIDAAKVMVDKLTGKSLQIGFVRFQHQKDATTALNTMNGEKLERDQPPLSVKYAENNWQRTARKSRNQTNASGIAELMNSSNISNISTISTFSNISNSPNLSNSPNFSHSLISPPMSPTYYYPPQMLYAPVQYLPVNYNYYISVAPQIDQYIPQWSSPAYYMTEQT